MKFTHSKLAIFWLIQFCLLLGLASCGGSGGTSSGSGGGTSVARVSGSISAGNARAGLDVEQRVFDSTGAIVAIGNFLISTAQAFTGVNDIPVAVVCTDAGTGAEVANVSGLTEGDGSFNIIINPPLAGPANCTATFGPDPTDPTDPDLVLVVTFGINLTTQTEVEVSLLDDGTLKLIGVRQEEGDNGTGSIQVTPEELADSSGKFPICHKPDTPAEKTLSLPASALPGHRGHGDIDGACPE